MKSQSFRYLVIIFALVGHSYPVSAQCPVSKYGICPVWPVNWNQSDKQNWYLDMSVHGQGFQSDGRTWRQIQEMVDSNLLVPFRNDVEWAKSNGGISQYLFQMRNPGPLLNSMPPAWCGNPLTDSNTTMAMYRFIQSVLDSMHTVLDYFVLGSDADVYFKSRPAERDSFLGFARKVSTFIDSTYPNIKFGIGVSLNGTIHSDTSLWNRVEPFTDFLAVSWWPLNSDYSVCLSDIDSAEWIISELLSEAGVKPVVIVDCGIPSGTESGSETIQADFVEKTFLYTMNHPQIEAVGFHFLSDFDSTQIYWYQNYFLTYGNEFYQSVKSRGLLDSLGNQKLAYDVYVSMLDTVCAHAGIPETSFNETFLVWPNPATEAIHIVETGFSQFSIYDASDRIVFSGKLMPSQQTISLTGLADGLYLIVLSSPHKEPAYGRFIKNGNR